MSGDPVQVHEMWQASCDACGWHSQPASPQSAVREWARLHRVTCPLKTGAVEDAPIVEVSTTIPDLMVALEASLAEAKAQRKD